MNCHIISIGDELLNGDILETNAHYLQTKLLSCSIFVSKTTILADDINDITQELLQSIKNNAKYIFITGGLGPTKDDITRDAIGQALGKMLIQDENALSQIQKKIQKHTLEANNKRQAAFPNGATIIENRQGTAAGFYIKEQKSHIFVMPGVPYEMKTMFEEELIPLLTKINTTATKAIPNAIQRIVIKTFGISEAGLDNIIKNTIYSKDKLPFKWASLVSHEGVFIKVYPSTKYLMQNADWKQQIKKRFESQIAKYIYAYDDDNMLSAVSYLLTRYQISIATVESCTGGLVSKLLTDYSGSSGFYLGGIVAYSNEIKEKLVNVDKEILDKYGAVSEQVAKALASNGKDIFGSDICIAITGIAGPLSDNTDKKVGTVHFGIKDKNNNITLKKKIFGGDRTNIRQKAAFYVLNLARLSLLQ